MTQFDDGDMQILEIITTVDQHILAEDFLAIETNREHSISLEYTPLSRKVSFSEQQEC